MNRSILHGALLTISLGFLAGGTLRAADAPASHDLSRIVPKDALLYLSWAGSDATVGSEQTAWHKLWAEAEMQAAAKTLWPRFLKSLQTLAAREGGDEGAALFEHGYALFELLRKKPFALSIGKIGLSEDVPGASAYVVVRAGDQAKAIEEHIEAILAMEASGEGKSERVTIEGVELRQFAKPPLPLPVRWGVVKDCFILTVGLTATQELVASINDTAASLASNPRFAAAMKHAGGSDGSLCAYLDVRGVIDTLRGFSPLFMAMRTPVLGDPATFRRLLEETELDNVEAIAYGLRPEAGGYMGRLFVYRPAAATQPTERTPAPPVPEANLARIPADATWAWAGTFDLAYLYDTVLGVVHAVSPNTGEQIERTIAEAEKTVGVRLRDDLLAALGYDWVAYDAPGNGGILFTGLTLSCGLRDADRFGQSVEKLVGFMEEQSHGKAKVEIETYRGRMIVFVNITGIPIPLAPAWTIHGGRVTFALYPQMVRTAIDQEKDGLPNLLSNPDFQRARKLMPPNPTAISYRNTAKGVSDIYSIVLPLAQMGAAMAQAEGVDVNLSMLPSSRTLCKHLFGTVSASAVTAEGYLTVSHGPWPINAPVLVGGGSVPLTAGMISILLPSLTRAREQARRAVSAANLRGIGVAMHMYAAEHGDAFPPNFDVLVEQAMISPKQLISPRDPSGGPCSYEYVAGQKAGDPRSVVAYERLYEGWDEGTNVLFADGHVEWMKKKDFEKALAATRSRLTSPGEEGKKKRPSPRADSPGSRPADDQP